MAYRRRRPRFGTTGCLFWLFILLVIVVIFLFRGKGNLKESLSFFNKLRIEGREELVRDKKREATAKADSETRKRRPAREEGIQGAAPEASPGAKPGETSEEKPGTRPGTALSPSSGQESSKKSQPEGKGAPESAGPAAEKPFTAERPKPAPEASQTKKGEIRTKNLAASLYFVRIDGEDGSVKPVPVERTIEYKDSPITKTFEALLRGPTEAERNKGIISLIPEGTRLLSARIHEGHLTLNFSHHFEENYTGREAILLELSQVILTSFDFNQVTAVSIRIDGKQKRYITGEGIPLKEAYTKQDLSSLKPES
jgi:spore germination protein GerM